MGLVSGSIYQNPLLPGKHDFERRWIYSAIIDILCKIHLVDVTEAGLDDYGKKGRTFLFYILFYLLGLKENCH